ncbi:MAG: hypothetical protein FNNCIFGK_00935 [Bacteroidia bacterium]|nr:hypothetical protein [Bacteroidia bacterium]MBV6453699.1 hypothetical protein [Bacteroidia bacterium]MCB0850277.1 hypothetical protein [Bacteroidota bacterium]MCE7954466.1 hypothetical protein [Bacteroidetes bacterium CHB6]
MENNKLDQLFDSARNTEPMVTFEEASEQFNIKASEIKTSAKQSLQWKYAILAVFAALVLGGGAYLVLNNNAVETTTQPQQESTTPVNETTIPAAEQPSAAEHADENVTSAAEETAAPAANEKAAEPAPLKNKITHVEKKSSSYIVENQTVNIQNDEGQFKVFFRGGQVDKVMLNNNELNESEWSQYDDVIAEAKGAMSKMGVDKENTASRKFVEYLFSTLKKKGLIENNLATVKLSTDALFIEGHEADSAVHQELLQQYKAITGQELGNRTLYFN